MAGKKIGFVGVLLLILVFIVWTNWPKRVYLQETTSLEGKSKLQMVVQEAMKGTAGTYGIVIKNFKTKETYLQNENREFTSGSLYKLWVAKEVYRQIKEGTLKSADVITEDIAGLNSYYGISDEEAELTTGVYSMTVGEALFQMITISHNNSALALAKKLGLKNVMPAATPLQISGFFEDLYQGKMVDATSSAKLIEILKKQENREILPKLLPAETVVAHKTGNLLEYYHDAGIVYSCGDYLFVGMSQSPFPPGAMERLAGLSRSVYDYFCQNQNQGNSQNGTQNSH